MAQVITSQLLGTKTNFTITLNSLGASATVGRQATVINNSANALDAQCQGSLTVGTVSGNKQILVYVAGSFDGGTTYSLGNSTNVIGASDAAFTIASPAAKPPACVVPTPTNSIAYTFDFSVAQMFGGSMPDHWTIVVINDTGAALSASGNNNNIWYKELTLQNN